MEGLVLFPHRRGPLGLFCDVSWVGGGGEGRGEVEARIGRDEVEERASPTPMRAELKNGIERVLLSLFLKF